jgi:hypothetical protein
MNRTFFGVLTIVFILSGCQSTKFLKQRYTDFGYRKPAEKRMEAAKLRGAGNSPLPVTCCHEPELMPVITMEASAAGVPGKNMAPFKDLLFPASSGGAIAENVVSDLPLVTPAKTAKDQVHKKFIFGLIKSVLGLVLFILLLVLIFGLLLIVIL